MAKTTKKTAAKKPVRRKPIRKAPDGAKAIKTPGHVPERENTPLDIDRTPDQVGSRMVRGRTCSTS